MRQRERGSKNSIFLYDVIYERPLAYSLQPTQPKIQPIFNSELNQRKKYLISLKAFGLLPFFLSHPPSNTSVYIDNE